MRKILGLIALIFTLAYAHTALAAIVYDSSVSGTGSTQSVATPALTTTGTNDIILVYTKSLQSGDGAITGVTDTAGLTYTRRLTVGSWNAGSGAGAYEEWYAVSNAALTSDVITATYTNSAGNAKRVTAVAYSGINTTTPFDSNASASQIARGAAGGIVSSVAPASAITTNNANDAILVSCNTSVGGTSSVPALPAGYTSSNTFGTAQVAGYITYSATQSGLTPTCGITGSSPSDYVVGTWEAVQQASATTTYTQNFDTLSNGTSVTTLAGWSAEQGTIYASNSYFNSSPNSSRVTTTGDSVYYTGLGSLTDQTVTAAVYLSDTSVHQRIHVRSTGGAATSASWYELIVGNNSTGAEFIIRKRTAGTDGSNFTLTGTSATTVVPATWYWVKFNVTGSSPANMAVKLWPVGSSEPSSYEVTTSDSSSPLTSGYPGYRGEVNIGASFLDDFTATSSVVTSLAAGTASLTSSGNATASVTVTAASGGTSPYTYQWYRSTTSGFTPGAGNIVTGATSLTLNDTGLTNGTTYYYVNKVTDSAGTPATANSNQVAATPAIATLTAGTASGTPGNTTAALTVGAATGGTSPYTYQWYRSTTSGFTPGAGNIVAGATSLTLNDTGLTNATTYYYVNKVTDAASATANSAQVSVTPTASCAAITVGASSVTSMGNTIATVAGSAASGGCATITYQWYRSLTPGFTPGSGNLLAGATSLTLNDTGLVNNVPYYYVLRATGGTSTGDYYQVAVVPASTVYLGLIGDSYETTYCPTAGGSVLVSNTSTSAGALVGSKLQAMYKDGTQVVWNNQGIGGTNGNDWAPGGTDMNGAVAAFNSTHSTHSDWTIMVHLGGNDASVNFSSPTGGESQAQYQTYMSAIANYFLNTWGAKNVVFMGPPYIKAMSTNRTAAGTALLASYQQALANVAAIYPGRVFAPQEEYRFIMANQNLIGTCDFVHPFQADTTGLGGTTSLSALWARSLYTVLNPNQVWTHY